MRLHLSMNDLFVCFLLGLGVQYSIAIGITSHIDIGEFSYFWKIKVTITFSFFSGFHQNVNNYIYSHLKANEPVNFSKECRTVSIMVG